MLGIDFAALFPSRRDDNNGNGDAMEETRMMNTTATATASTRVKDASVNTVIREDE